MNKNKPIDSKEKLLNAGLELFAMKGFDGTSTRQICNKAGVNISLIPYYFGSKEGLYAAVIELITEKAFTNMQPTMKKLANLENINKEKAKELFLEFLSMFANFVLSDEVPNSFPVLMVREQVEQTPTFEIMYDKVTRHVYKTFRYLLAIILDKDEMDTEIIFRVSAIIGQVISYRAARLATLRALNKEDYSKTDIKHIKRIILEQTESIINSAGDLS